MLKHIERDYTMTMAAQKKAILKEYPGCEYIMCHMGIITIMVPYEGR